jgi:zinc transport system substrate-binding protein
VSVKLVRVLGKLIVITLFILIFAQSGFATDRVPVFVSIVPQKYFVQQIGKDLVDVHVMAQPGASPATYEPKPKQMADLSKTKVYFSIGVPFGSRHREDPHGDPPSP